MNDIIDEETGGVTSNALVLAEGIGMAAHPCLSLIGTGATGENP